MLHRTRCHLDLFLSRWVFPIAGVLDWYSCGLVTSSATVFCSRGRRFLGPFLGPDLLAQMTGEQGGEALQDNWDRDYWVVHILNIILISFDFNYCHLPNL